MSSKEIIFFECMKPGGFADLIRINKVDEIAFKRLLTAVNNFTSMNANQSTIDRLTIACLFELPWEIENTVEHYQKQSKDLGMEVSKMADQLRSAINELLWKGLEHHYQNL